MLAQEIDEYWKTVVDIIQDGIMIVDRSGQIVSVNKAMETITGYGREEVIGKPCSTLNCDICEIVREDREDQWCDLFKNGFVHLKKGIIRKKDGNLVHILKNASVLRFFASSGHR